MRLCGKVCGNSEMGRSPHLASKSIRHWTLNLLATDKTTVCDWRIYESVDHITIHVVLSKICIQYFLVTLTLTMTMESLLWKSPVFIRLIKYTSFSLQIKKSSVISFERNVRIPMKGQLCSDAVMQWCM